MTSGETVRGFGELESEIMDFVWSADGSVLVRDVREAINGRRPIAYTSVQTVMEILHRKGWLTRAKDGRAFRYTATATAEDYTARLMAEALDDAPNRAASLLRFVDTLDEAEAAGLRAALEQVRGQGATS
jgi:predicted transcriptional regulator